MAPKRITIAVAGDSFTGKSSLTASLSRFISDEYGISKAVSYEKLADGFEKNTVACETPDREFCFMDYTGDASWMGKLIEENKKPDGIILVVRDKKGAGKYFDQFLQVVNGVGIDNVFVFINTEYNRYDESLCRRLEDEIGRMLEEADLDHDGNIFHGCALDLVVKDESEWTGSLEAVISNLSMIDPVEISIKDKAFLMPVSDVFHDSGKGTLASGTIEKGTVQPGDQIQIVNTEGKTQAAAVSEVRIRRQSVSMAQAGSVTDLLLAEAGIDDVSKGDILAAEGSFELHNDFSAIIYLYGAREGGLQVPAESGIIFDLYFRKSSVKGTLNFADADKVLPGTAVNTDIRLADPRVIETGLKFYVTRDRRRTIGVGRITRLNGIEDAFDSKIEILLREADRLNYIEGDYKAALPLYQQAADMGDDNAQFSLGLCYEYGNGVEIDLEKAFYWYEKSAQQKDPDSVNKLAECYLTGLGTQADPVRAFRMFMHTAEAGSITGMQFAGDCYFEGKGTEKDEKKAYQCYQKVIDQEDDPWEISYLAEKYEQKAENCESDLERVLFWYQAAVDKGSEEDAEKLAEIGKRLEKLRAVRETREKKEQEERAIREKEEQERQAVAALSPL